MPLTFEEEFRLNGSLSEESILEMLDLIYDLGKKVVDLENDLEVLQCEFDDLKYEEN